VTGSSAKTRGLNHLGLSVLDLDITSRFFTEVLGWPGVVVEFPPEPLGKGPRKHMMCLEPGGIRVEFIWPGI
jgi:lactoylglutathione lyase